MKSVVSMFASFVLSAGLLFGQAESGTVVGTVTDSSGTVVPGAAVTLVNEGTGFTRRVVTNAQGQFSANAFPPGSITITVEQSGFQKLVRNGVQLTAADTITVNLQLVVGDVHQTIQVTETAPLLEAQNAAVSQLVDNKQVQDLPLNGRQFTTLITLSPGAYAGSAGNLSGAVYALRANTNFSVNGSQGDNNTYLIDGMTNKGLWLDNLVIVPTVDSIQEIRAMTSNYSAEYGSSAGMVTIVQTKSGTDRFHGDVYEFLQNADLNANNFFSNLNGLPRTGARRNEFGGTIGGPIRKDKTFFFADYQGLRIGTPITTYSALLPSSAQRSAVESGNFAGFATVYNPFSVVNGQRQPFAGNAIPASLLDPAAVKLMSLLPAPNVIGNSTTNFALSPTQTQRTNQTDGRIDQNIGSSDRIFGKFSYDNTLLTNPGFLPMPANSLPGPYLGNVGYFTTYKNWSVTLNYTKVISATTVNELRVGAVRWNHVIIPLGTESPGGTLYDTAQALGIPGINVNSFAAGLPGMTINGQNWYFGDTSTFPETNRELTYQYEDIITKVEGQHTFKFGGEYLRYILNGYSAYPTRGAYTFSGAFTTQIGTSNTTPNAFADFALGAPASFSRNILPGTFGMRFWNASGFADDTWRITNNLTLNLGLRYEVQAPPYEVDNRWSNFNVITGRLLAAGQGGNSRTLRKTDDNNFGPRVGVAYTINPKTVVRSGFGMSYNEAYNVGQQLYKNAPNFLSQTYSPAQGQTPTLLLSKGVPVPTAPAVVNGVVQIAPGTLPYAWDFNMRTPKILQWSFGIQRELGQNLVLELSYVGTRGIDLLSNVNYNQAYPSSDPSSSVASRRPLAAVQPNVAAVQYWTNWGASKYHSLQTHLQKRYSHGLTAGVSYTWSHNLTDAQAASQSGDPIQNARCYSCEWSNALEDRRHVLVINHVYELPFGKDRDYLRTGRLSAVAGGWDVTGIWTVQTGPYFNVLMASAVSNTGPNVAGGTYDRPNRIADGNSGAPQSIYQWFNTAAFATPAFGAFGNAAENVIYGPGLFNLDAGIHRNFQIRERWRIEFRAEMFNTLNHANFSTPNGTFGSSLFGRITTTANAARISQFSVKIHF